MAAMMQFSEVLESVREPGTANLSPGSVADLLGMTREDLAVIAKVHRNTLRIHPESPRVQAFLRDVMRVMSAAALVQPDVNRALFLIQNAPIPPFEHKTLLDMVKEGRTDAAVAYLESVSSGYVG